jgi:hypothetical protein
VQEARQSAFNPLILITMLLRTIRSGAGVFYRRYAGTRFAGRRILPFLLGRGFFSTLISLATI